ncbi:hypothetical protein SY89_00399 [Halolamina pelagica]|uniref:Cytochrome P450 n=1 Tax=Halolamina pelagica TaxID=699431 RepID=A0A0P7GVX2_9EURY|nr:hypothetical protein [Halolamina pelagica]KPN29684.1 hypothetical protein SY89_00399 [Halolamina pelagica]
MTSADTTATDLAERAGDADGVATPPGPDGYPVLGNVLSLADDAFEFYETLSDHGDVARYRVLGRRATP